MSNPIDQIRKLIALATNNPNEEEARSAALKACKMIAESKINLTPPPPTISVDHQNFYADALRRAYARRTNDLRQKVKDMRERAARGQAAEEILEQQRREDVYWAQRRWGSK